MSIQILTRSGLPEKYDKQLAHALSGGGWADPNFIHHLKPRWLTETVKIDDCLFRFPDGKGILATLIRDRNADVLSVAVIAYDDFDELMAWHEEDFIPKEEPLPELLDREQTARVLGLRSPDQVRVYWNRGLIARAPKEQWRYPTQAMYTRASVEAYLAKQPARGNPNFRKA